LLCLSFFIETFNPIFSDNEFSNSLIFGSLWSLSLFFFVLKILTKFSVCLTESFFSIILLATKVAFSRPTKILHDQHLILKTLLTLLHFQAMLKV
jgi:hypothetical protein